MDARAFLPTFALLATLLSPTSAAFADDSLSFSGKWRFELDRADVGLRERWFARELSGTIHLPGSLQEQGCGDPISTQTTWTGSFNDRSWFTAERYAPYREPGNVKVPFWLQPDRSYVGVAWYQREIEIPNAWRGRRLVVSLERAHWGTTLWVDEVKIGSRDGLGTPQVYDLGITSTPGRHRLTLRIDNHEIIPVGADAHSISDHTQGNWNGVAGRLALTATDRVWFADLRVFPNAARREARVTVAFGNATGAAGHGTLTATVRSLTGPRSSRLQPFSVPVVWSADGGTAELTCALGPDAPLWDEFNPALHELTLEVPGVIAPRQVRFGLRDVAVADKQITVNGRRIFLRGTLECCIFPQHGYPPTDLDSWRRLLGIARAHGLNHLRFHSWCPPEAAFVAADEMGFYYQVECSAWANQFNKNTSLDTWIYDESERIVAANGNHPSFLLLVASNEPGGPGYEKFLGRFVDTWKRKDPRRLYAAGSGWPSIPENDFDVTPDSRAYPVHAALNGRNEGDYRSFLDRRDRPVVSHEIGQYCVFPNLEETRKYRGLYRARNFEIVQDFMDQAGLAGQANAFLHASGRLQTVFYKDEIEACLRTPGWSGFQLLDLHDFPGQGTALIGVLDAFWGEKGYVKPAEYRRFCDETVPLARLASRVWTSDQVLAAGIEVAHFGARDLTAASVTWHLRTAAGKTVAQGTFSPCTLPTGAVTPVGRVEWSLARIETAAALTLTVRIPGTRFLNDWNLWVYPPAPLPPVPANVTLARELDPATLAALDRGERVVLLADPHRVAGKTTGRFDPVFWNRLWFPSQPQHTLGLLLDPRHPALALFPTASHSDWQWQDLQNHSKPMILDALPRDLQPVVQVIDDWNTCRKLGLVIEAGVGRGRLLLCSLDLESDLATRPAARQLRSSLLRYAASRDFKPKISLQPDQLRTLFRNLTTPEKLGARVLRASSAQDGYAASLALDGDPATLWHTAWGDQAPGFPHELVLEFPAPVTLAGLTVLPRQDNNHNGWIKGYEIFVSPNGTDWGIPVARGELPADAEANPITFAQPISVRFLKLRALSGHANGPWASVAELGLLLP